MNTRKSTITRKTGNVGKNSKRREIRVKKLRVRRSPVLLLFKLITLDIIFLFAGIVQYLIVSTLPGFNLLDTYILVLMTNLGLGIIWLLYTGWIILKWRNNYYEIFPGAVIEHDGVFYKNEKSFSCDRIASVESKQTFLGRMFNYGVIRLYDPFLEKYIYLYNVTNPARYANVLKDIYVKTKRIPTTTPEDKILVD